MGDAHEVVVHHVGEVVGGQAVGLEEDLVVQLGVVHSDVPVHRVVEGGGALGDALADDVGLPGVYPGLGLGGGKGAAGVGLAVEIPGILLALLLLAEAVVGVAPLHQQTGVLSIGVPALGLDIGGHRAAHVGALVVVQPALRQGAVDHLCGTLHPHGLVDDIGGIGYQTALVGVLDAQDELAPGVAGDEIGVQGSAKVAHMHISRGRGSESGTHLSLGDARLHVLEPLLIQSHRKDLRVM